MLRVNESGGLYSTVLPVFSHSSWPRIVPATGFVWITSPFVDLSGQIDAIVATQLFGSADVDLECSVHEVDLDVSVPAALFLRHVESAFPHGVDLAHSAKRQPPGFRLDSIPRANWPDVMARNQISFVLHRPAGGEPSLMTSCERDIVAAVVDAFADGGR